MLQLVSLWGQMSVKSVTADHADPSHNHGRADPVATLSLGTCLWWDGRGDKSRQPQPRPTPVSENTSARVAAPHIAHRREPTTAAPEEPCHTPRQSPSHSDNLCEPCTVHTRFKTSQLFPLFSAS